VAKRESLTKKVVYLPPASEDIHLYTNTVCRELGQKVDANLDDPEFRREFAGFIKIVASIYSKHLTKSGNQLDNDS
jgi:hypothetical protein